MQRYILFVLFLCLHWVAWGQTDYGYRYWFDNDDANVQSGDAPQGPLHLDVDLSGLDASLHAIHLQVRDGEGEWSAPMTRYFVKKVSATTSIVYWLDGDPLMHGATPQGGHFDIDVSALADGMHHLRLRLDGPSGDASSFRSCWFMKVPRPDRMSMRYWFDSDHGSAHEAAGTGGPVMLDVSGIEDGFHRISTQVLGEGSCSLPVTSMFIKVPQTEGVDNLTCFCLVDGKPYLTESVPSGGGVVKWDMDVSSLSQGLHTIQVQVLTPSGAATNVSNHFFFRSITAAELDGMKLVYSLDGQEYRSVPGDAANGVFHFDVDVASLEDGLHRLIYQLAGESGVSTKVNTSFFWKIPVGGYGITEYRYWLNGNEEKAVACRLEERMPSFSLVKLLPVESEPVRSECFHFELKAGRPTMYAKNDFHITFYDASGRRVDETKQFVDYGVSLPVEEISDLLPEQTFARPGDNTVKWFRFEAETGDTIALRSSQAASLQVFAPGGSEVYSANGDKSVAYGGCHVWEDGTYYVAVHDVTGTRPDVTLSYMHMDRYDVVSQDVYAVGNGGCSTVTFHGNGFDELESVTLVSDVSENSIPCDSITRMGNVNAPVRFNFSGATLGRYHAVFRFKDGTKRIENCITVEDAKPITIGGKVTFATQYLRSRNNDYIIKLTNNGNSTAYNVPLALCVFTTDIADLNYVNVTGVDFYSQLKERLPELFGQTFVDSVRNIMPSRGIMPLFVRKDSVDFIEGFPAMHKAIVSVDLQPNTTRTVTVSINAGNKAFVYAWYPDEWDTLIERGGAASLPRRATVIDDALCGMSKEQARMCADNEMMEQNGLDPIYKVDCSGTDPNRNCPPPPGGGGSTSVNSLDPNDIFGYISPSGSRFVCDSALTMNYRIEFENDTAFATASAHVVEIKDTLDGNVFNLPTYAPTGIKIGDKTVYLDGTPEFVRTVDMRPAIDAIVQVEGAYDPDKGIATWLFTSLDPMTMEPTDDVMQGFLPVNYDGISGIGEVTYTVGLKERIPDGTEIPNRASIVFDTNDPIMTPVWTNTVDAVAPESSVANIEMVSDTTVRVSLDGTDNRSGIWKYTLYVQHGVNAPWWEEAVLDSCSYDFRFYEGIDYGLCVLATDSAGNVERKDMRIEFGFRVDDDVIGIGDVRAVQQENVTTDTYDLSGRKVGKNAKGIVIRNRRKELVK